MCSEEVTNQLGETDWDWLGLELKSLYRKYVQVFGEGIEKETNRDNFRYLVFNTINTKVWEG